MSYLVLARKWRPRNFETVAGQEHVLRPLINALDKPRLHHAYLFTGTHGTGKTTIARILAKCLNCEQGITSHPCGQCNACKEIDEGRFVDLIEVDAASRTKVEDTRDLLDNVQYLPTRGRYKIYLIDEVHMLSGHSFNALLKTLEEPPEHVKFLLATTDPQKLPATVLSRCLQFHLKNLPSDRISNYLQNLLQEENISFEPTAVQLISQAANGSMRDALSLLDQAIAYGQNNINENDVSAMLGTIKQEHIELLLTALAEENGKQLLAISAQLSEQGADYSNVLEALMSWLQQIAIAQVVPDGLDPQNPNTNSIIKLSKRFQKEDIQLYYQIALMGRRDLPFSSEPKNGFEMTLLRMLAFRPITEKTAEKKTVEIIRPIIQNNTSTKTSLPEIYEQNKEVKTEKEKKPVSQSSNVDWNTLLPQLNLTGIDYSLASNCSLKKATNEQIELILNEKFSPLLNENCRKRLTETINKHFNKELAITITIGKPVVETPAEIAQRAADKQHQTAVKNIENDALVQSMAEEFGAIVDPSLIKAE